MASIPSERSGDQRSRLTPASLFFVLLLLWVFTQIQLVLILGLLALLLGTILERPVQFFQERRFPRAVAILAVYIIILGSFALLLFSIVPVISREASEFSANAPAQLRELEEDWSASSNPLLSGPGDQLLQRAIDTIEGDADPSQATVDRAIPLVTSTIGGIVATVTLLVMTFYYLLEKRLLRNLILESLTVRFRERIDRLWTDVETKVGGWMRGQLILCLIIGSIATTAYGIIGLEFWPLLGLWAGLTEIIPIIGPWIGGIPAVLIALTMGPEIAIITIVIIVAMQSLENWVLVPRVMRGAVGLTPLTVFVAILAGTQLMGIVGAILAIPIAATIQVILTDFLDRRRDRDEHMTARAGWRWMLSRSGLRESEEGDSQHGSGRHGADEPYIAQQESESFTVRAVDETDASPQDEPGDEQDDDGPSRDADRRFRTAAPDADRGGPNDRPDDDRPAFAAWPRPTVKQPQRPPTSTWPRLEEGRRPRRR